ncbi:transposase [Micromonospora kangleipakensis]|uniref:Transposase n=1 Tax=Micromonospora kangleipakensis TaxID=1077942 RepID=A0A4Q8B5M6_9ACTN|nr:transposase [Micromonospora kangleipakensis]
MTEQRDTAQHPVAIGGVDTHGDTHHAAVLDEVGRQLADRSFPTTPAGYRQLLAWLRSFGRVERVGVEGTGAYGAALARMLRQAGVTVVEVDRPDRKARRDKCGDRIAVLALRGPGVVVNRPSVWPDR